MIAYLAVAALALVVCVIGEAWSGSKRADARLHRDLEEAREKTGRVTALREARERHGGGR